MTGIELLPAGDARERRYLIRMQGRHAGGVTVHSVQGDVFSYGVAIAPGLRRRGVAAAALCALFERMRAQGFRLARVRVCAGNAASLALHAKLGFARVAEEAGVVTLEKRL